MLPFHQFHLPNKKDYTQPTDTATAVVVVAVNDRPTDSISYQGEPTVPLVNSRPRRNTVGSCVEDSSSCSSSDESYKSLVPERRTKSWYEGFLDSFKNNVLGGESPQQIKSIREGKTRRMKGVLNDIIQLCPEENRLELTNDHVSFIRQKINDPVVTIGICGEPESGRRTLLNVLQHSKNHAISSPDTRIAFKLCPFIDPSTAGESPLNKEFKFSLLSCSAYLCVLSCDQLNECSTCTRLLEMLLQRDKDIFHQRRALMIVNKLDVCFTKSDSTADHHHPLPPPTPLPFLPPPPSLTTRLNDSITGLSMSSSSSEYLHYDRFHDHEDFEQFVRQTLQKHMKYNTGIVIPDHCIIATMLQWSQLSRDYHRGIEEGIEVEEQLEEWLDMHEPYRKMTADIKGMTNEQLFEVITGIADIESWVERHAENIKTLKDLSIISDIIYCIHYCIDKLQKDIDTCSMKIENLESLQVQRSQLMNDLSHLYNCVTSYKRDASLFDSLMEAYDRDIQEPLEDIRKLAHKLIDRFREMSVSKLNRLIHCNFEHLSVEALQETCELDIASFSRGATNKLKAVLRTVVFRNMHGVLPFKVIKDNSQELTKLGDHLLKERTSLEMTRGFEEDYYYSLRSTHDNTAYCYSRMSCTSGLELYYPVTLDAVSEGASLQMIASELHPHFYSMLHFHSATISAFSDDDNTPIKHKHLGEEVKDNFIKHCERYLTAEELKRKAVQFHMEIMKEYITNFLEQFDKKYRHKLEGIQVQMNDDINTLKQARERNENNLKKIITLKVDLELLRAELLRTTYV